MQEGRFTPLRRRTMLALLRCCSFVVVVAAIPALGQDESAGRAVTIEVAILEFSAVDDRTTVEPEIDKETLARLRQLEKDGKANVVMRMRFTTLENLLAMVQHGESLSVPSGFVVTPGRTRQTSYTRDSSGTMVTAVPRIEEGGQILVELSVEQSRYPQLSKPVAENESQAGNAGADDLAPPTKQTLTAKTTLRIPDGETVIAHLMEGTAGEGRVVRAVLVKASAAENRSR